MPRPRRGLTAPSIMAGSYVDGGIAVLFHRYKWDRNAGLCIYTAGEGLFSVGEFASVNGRRWRWIENVVSGVPLGKAVLAYYGSLGMIEATPGLEHVAEVSQREAMRSALRLTQHARRNEELRREYVRMGYEESWVTDECGELDTEMVERADAVIRVYEDPQREE